MTELTLDALNDIQGIILSGYGHLPEAAFVFLQIRDGAKAKAWLRKVIPDTMTAKPWPVRADGTKEKPETALNIAITHSGLRALGLSEAALLSFSREFVLGMPQRKLILGDTGASDPEHWEMGGPNNEEIHVVLMLYAVDEEQLNRLHQRQRSYIQESDGGVVDVPPSGPRQRGLATLSEEAPGAGASSMQRAVRRVRPLAATRRVRQVLSAEAGEEQRDLGPPPAEAQGVMGKTPEGQLECGISKEPFGFADGISQPEIEGTPGNPDPGQWVIKTGEFILGYLDEYNVYPPGPAVPAAQDPNNMLPRFPEGALPDCHDLGRNGTYLVYRKLEQDVAGFWQFIEENADSPDDAPDQTPLEYEMNRLASKFVGRWPSGAPLVLAPLYDDSRLGEDERRNNAFTYQWNDVEGFACPIGSHIRRANPRDSLAGNSPEDSFKSSNRHRLLRRGIHYGQPLFPPEAVMNGHAPVGLKDDGQPRGLQFFAINSDISRQFEFIQQTWCNKPIFNGLYDNKDPILGDNDGSSQMTIQRNPIRKEIKNIPRFVSVKGGAYFFMPSITALRYLADGA